MSRGTINDIGQWLAEVHRGELTAISELKQGSRFRVRLPLNLDACT